MTTQKFAKTRRFVAMTLYHFILISFTTSILAVQAQAGLGDHESIIPSDTTTFGAQKAIKKISEKYTVHTLDTGGSLIREYISPSGLVFAVSWKGTVTPDLKSLLSGFYDEYTSAKAASAGSAAALSSESERRRVRAANRRHEFIQTPRMVIRRGGHMRAWRGLASVPSLIPDGVNVESLQ